MSSKRLSTLIRNKLDKPSANLLKDYWANIICSKENIPNMQYTVDIPDDGTKTNVNYPCIAVSIGDLYWTSIVHLWEDNYNALYSEPSRECANQRAGWRRVDPGPGYWNCIGIGQFSVPKNIWIEKMLQMTLKADEDLGDGVLGRLLS